MRLSFFNFWISLTRLYTQVRLQARQPNLAHKDITLSCSVVGVVKTDNQIVSAAKLFFQNPTICI
jgi:hypothetical protein